MVLDNYDRAIVEELFRARANETKHNFVISCVRGIVEAEVEKRPAARRIAVQEIASFRDYEVVLIFVDLQRSDIRQYQCAHFSRLIDEGDVCRAARQCLDSDGARAGAKIQKKSTLDAGRENIEQGLAQPVRRRSRLVRWRAFEPPSAIFSADNAHKNKSDHG